jgi:soluble lytic murein transglycosylase-like protein
MRKLLLLLTLTVSSASPSLAQTAAAYRVDNFDFANLVHIEAPAPKPAKKISRIRRLTTTQNFKYSPSAEPLTTLTQPTSMTLTNALGGFTTGDSTVDSLIAESGRRNSVDPLLLYSIMHQESTFKPRAVSPKGARGLMQLMPPTAARFGVTNIFDPRQNIEGGARYMRFLLDLFSGDVNLALAGYNAGEGAVMKYGYQVPPYSETQEYVRRISKRYNLIRDPMAASHANQLTPGQLAATRQKDSVPLTTYEKSVFAMRLPDGRLQLVSQ